MKLENMNQKLYLSVCLVSSIIKQNYISNNIVPIKLIKRLIKGEPSTFMNVVTTVVEVIDRFKTHYGSCIRWGFGNYKTFDGKMYSFHSDCSYTLISDIKTNAFHVQAHFDHGMVTSINIYIIDNLYQVKRNCKIFNSK